MEYTLQYHPNIMDCKLGRITWTSQHSEEITKTRETRNHFTTIRSLGFRITGMIIKDSRGNTVEKVIKTEASSRTTAENIHEYFRKMVMEQGRLQIEVIETFIRDIERIKEWFGRNTEKTFKASSLLFVNGKNAKAQCRYIDFAHCEESEGRRDDNVIEGIENVILIWKRLLSS